MMGVKKEELEKFCLFERCHGKRDLGKERFFVIKKKKMQGEAKKTRYSYLYFYLLLLITPIHHGSIN